MPNADEFKYEEPRPNGIDSDNTLLYKIAIRIWRWIYAGTETPILSTAPKQFTGVPSNFTVATADGTVFTLAAGEKGFIQNLDSADALAVKLGASASTSSFNFLLACGAAQDDGKGGLVEIKDFVGVVSVATMTGTGRYIAWKEAP